jgi:hypothetical protein
MVIEVLECDCSVARGEEFGDVKAGFGALGGCEVEGLLRPEGAVRVDNKGSSVRRGSANLTKASRLAVRIYLSGVNLQIPRMSVPGG